VNYSKNNLLSTRFWFDFYADKLLSVPSCLFYQLFGLYLFCYFQILADDTRAATREVVCGNGTNREQQQYK